MRSIHKFRHTGIIMLMLLVFLTGCNSEEKSASSSPFLDANSPEELELLMEWHNAYIYPDEFGYDRTAKEALSTLYGNEKYSVETSADNEVIVHYSATGVINDKEHNISYDLSWDTLTNIAMPIKMTVDGVEMAPRFMEGFIYVCEGYKTLGDSLINEAVNGNTASYWEEMNGLQQSVHDEALEIDREIEEFWNELNQYGNNQAWEPVHDKLSEFYIGSLSACNMSSEQAEAFASLIENELWQYPVVMAALFDGGNGIPLLWIAHGSDGEWAGNPEYGFTYRIENNYNAQIYAYNNGTTEKCSWMTKLLKAGTDGIIVQIDLDPMYEFGTYFRMFRLNGGKIEPYSFATGAHNPFGECILNSITVAEDGELSELDLFRLVDIDIEYLLSAETGFSGMLILSGNWVDGATMQSALYDYAAAFR